MIHSPWVVCSVYTNGFLCFLPGICISILEPLLDLIFLVKVANLGWPGNIASSGKKRDMETPFSEVSGLYSGKVNPGHPSRGKFATESTISFGGRSICASFLRNFMFASTILRCTGKAPYGQPGVP